MAFRGKNLRSGDIAEQIGLLLLQSVALVAPVPRTEDVGVDAVVTLIRDFDSRRYIAEDSFFVQIKSKSIKTVCFDRNEINWLLSLELPFFVASVDRKIGEVELYCTHRISDAVITNHERESIKIHLEPDQNKSEFVDPADENIFIGPPILKWNFNTLDCYPNFFEHFYAIAKEHIKVSKESIRYRKFGLTPYLVWRTNEVPKLVGSKSTLARNSEVNGDDVYDEMMPYFSIWLNELVRTRDFSPASDVVALLDEIKFIIDGLNKMNI